MNLQEALEQKGFKQSNEEVVKPKIAEKSLKTEDKVITESKKEWKN